MRPALALLACAVLGLAACGSSRHAAATTAPCRAPAASLARLQADIRALRSAARLPTTDTLVGNRAVNAATDRFLHDVELAPIGNLRRNRLIDHAMGTLAGACEQCFQALEAARPIENIRVGERAC